MSPIPFTAQPTVTPAGSESGTGAAAATAHPVPPVPTTTEGARMLARLIGGPANDAILDLPMRRARLAGRAGKVVEVRPAYVLVAVIDDHLVPLPPPGPDCRDVLNYAAGRWDTYTLRARQPRNDGLVRMEWTLPPERRARCLDAMTRIVVHFTTERAHAAAP